MYAIIIGRGYLDITCNYRKSLRNKLKKKIENEVEKRTRLAWYSKSQPRARTTARRPQ